MPAQTKVRISPSKMELTALCPGSPRMGAPYKWEDSAAASRGRGLHDAMALLFQVGTAAFDKIKGNPSLDPEDVKVLPEVFKLGLSQRPADDDLQVIVEEALDCSFMGIEGGKPDLVFLSEAQKAAVIIDWKFGARPVEKVESNKQLTTYACAYLAKHPWLETVEVVIIQPFGANPDAWASVHTWTKDALRAQAKDLIAAAKAAREPGAPCVAGAHCVGLFCNARKDGETKEGAPITACKAYLDFKARVAAGKAEEKAAATAELVKPAPGAEVLSSADLTVTQAATPGLEVVVKPESPITGPFYIATADTIAAANAKKDFALSLRVVDRASAEVAGRTRQDLAKLSKLVKDNREALNAPLLALQRAMIAREKEVTGPLDEASAHLQGQVTAFAQAEEKKRQVAAQAAEDRRRKAEAEEAAAKAEQERKQAEADKQAREAQELLDKAANLKTKAARDKATAEANAKAAAAAESQRKAQEEEEKRLQAARAQERADAEAQAALQPAPKVAGYRMAETADYAIPDYAKIPAALLEVVLQPNDKVIKEMIKTGALNEAKHGAWLTITRGTKALGSR